MKAKPRRPPAAGRTRGARAKSPPPPLLTETDLRRAVFELANVLAPGDVDDLLGNEEDLRERAGRLDGEAGKLMRAQLELAIMCLRDHVAGNCPQIPYYTISMLAAGLAYLIDELDLIPDFLPGIGTLDDALVMAMACRLAEDGLRRYCTWKEIDPAPALGAELRRT
jgi:uncharacterized membrane protein YkvA (DUF1232 family)